MRRFILLLAALFFVFAAYGCGGSSNPVNGPSPDNNVGTPSFHQAQWSFGSPLVVNLVAGKNIVVGTVTVTNDFNNLYVTYQTTGDWYLAETHLHVAKTYAEIPKTKKGNPIPGQFGYGGLHNPPVQSVTYTVSLGSWQECEQVFIAAHAVVKKIVGGTVVQTETGWGNGSAFGGGNWGMYFTYVIQGCLINLPETPVTAHFYYPGPTSYWRTVLSNVPAGFDVTNGDQLGWCIQQFVYIYPGQQYQVRLIPTYVCGGCDLPSCAQGVDWERINYILNHKHPNASLYDVQAAIWYFTPDGYSTNDPEALSMIQDALANGEGYKPGGGEIMAVLVYGGDNVQCTFIEVTVGC